MAHQALLTIRGDEPALQWLRCNPIWTEQDAEELRRMLPTVTPRLLEAKAQADSLLCPAPRDLTLKGLGTALALVVPTGFSEQDRKLWLAVALETVKDLPTDLLQRGIIHARRVADHPSKVVPSLMAEVAGEWERRKRDSARIDRLLALAAEPDEPVQPEHVEPMTLAEISTMPAMMVKIGLSQGWLTQEQVDEAREAARDREAGVPRGVSGREHC